MRVAGKSSWFTVARDDNCLEEGEVTTRRDLLKASIILPALAPAHTLAQQAAAPNEGFFEKMGFVSSRPGSAAVGTGRSRHEEIVLAFKLLFAAPRDVPPIAVAEYFEDITVTNRDKEGFNAEWKTKESNGEARANPVILGFFSATNTVPRPNGDQTSWCAAFVSFCLMVAGRDSPLSALSGDYRRFGEKVQNPEKGDLVVYSERKERGEAGYGHVGFYVSENDDGIQTLGGNQSNSVRTTTYPREGNALTLFGFRRI